MRAAVMRDKQIVVDTVPDPEPGNGQVLVKTLACGICGSDLHALHFADEMARVSEEAGTPFALDPTHDVVMGHEFPSALVLVSPPLSASSPPCLLLLTPQMPSLRAVRRQRPNHPAGDPPQLTLCAARHHGRDLPRENPTAAANARS